MHTEGRESLLKDQVHIRNAEAAHLARALAQQTGRTINEVCLKRCGNIARAAAPSRRRRVEHWRRLLREDRRQARHSLAFFDETTGPTQMIVLDSSVLVGIIKREGDTERWVDLIAAEECEIGAPTLLETRL